MNKGQETKLDPWAKDFAWQRLNTLGLAQKAEKWLQGHPPPETWFGSVWEYAETEMPTDTIGEFIWHPLRTLGRVLGFSS